MEQVVSIELFGVTYSFKAETEVENIEDVVGFLVGEVDKVEAQLADKPSQINKLTIMIVAALNIANEHIELKRNCSVFLNDISKRTTSLIRDLNSIVG